MDTLAYTKSGSVIQIVLNTTPFAKLILLVLLIFSVISWAIIIRKWLFYRAVRNANRSYLAQFSKRQDALQFSRTGPRFDPSAMPAVLSAAVLEWQRLTDSRSGIRPGPASADAAMQIVGDYAYCVGYHSLQIFNIDSLQSPKLAGGYSFNDGSWNRGGIAVRGDYAYLTSGGRLKILNIADPTNIQFIAQTDSITATGPVTLLGNYCYVADVVGYPYSYSLKIIDITNIYNPQFVNDTHISARDICTDGIYLYTASDMQGFKVLSVDDPVHPTVIGSYATSGIAEGVAISGNYAFVADSDDIEIINIENHSNPILINRCFIGGGNFVALKLQPKLHIAVLALMESSRLILEM